MMRRIAWAAGALLASTVLPSAAGASGDFGCDANWQLASRSFGACSNAAMISPGNDTRVNLFFLLREGQSAPAASAAYRDPGYYDQRLGRNFFSWRTLRQTFYPAPPREDGEDEVYGSRCQTLGSGGDAFVAALGANRGVPAADRDSLTRARATIAKACVGGDGFAAPTDVRSAAGREFLAYLQAADAFYGAQWDMARGSFDRLRGSRDPWLAETGAYMVARTDLNAAQDAAFDEYGSFAPEKVDKAALARARAGFDAYLARYGQGRYAGSARGLVRRTLWLAGDVVGLARAYERLLATPLAAGPAAPDLVEEIDAKLLMGNDRQRVDSPLLLATIDFMMMREAYEGGPQPISAEQLAGQAKVFAGQPDLYGFILASHAFYVEKDPAKVLRLIPDDARRPGYAPLAFSRQVLRGMALAARGDRNEAGFWRELLGGAQGVYQRPMVELGLAMAYERSGRLAEIFAPDSPIGETAIREVLIQSVAGPDILRAQAGNTRRPQHERALALFTLLHKQLIHGDYAAFGRDSALIPAQAEATAGLYDLRLQPDIPVGLFRKGTWSDGYPCPALGNTVATLARAPRDVKARLCLGDFYRLNGFDDFGAINLVTARDELGGTPTLFPGKPMPRGDFYAEIIADPKAGAEDKAYALYRAVNCYAPSGSNQCGGADVAQNTRRGWFQRLKRDHPASPWAQKLKYYW